jgi:hypothetical protein
MEHITAQDVRDTLEKTQTLFTQWVHGMESQLAEAEKPFSITSCDGGGRKVVLNVHSDGKGLYVAICNPDNSIVGNINIPAQETIRYLVNASEKQ